MRRITYNESTTRQGKDIDDTIYAFKRARKIAARSFNELEQGVSRSLRKFYNKCSGFSMLEKNVDKKYIDKITKAFLHAIEREITIPDSCCPIIIPDDAVIIDDTFYIDE